MTRVRSSSFKEYRKNWAKENKDKLAINSKKYQERYPEKKMLKASKQNAKARNLEHTITLEDIVIPEYCPYLGIKLTTKVESTNVASTVSLDRIDSSKGYISGNVQVISRLANQMKSNANKEQLITFAKNVLNLYE